MSFSVSVTGADEGAVRAIADAIAERLAARHVPVEVLDPRTPGFDALAGEGLARRLGFVCGLLARHGVATIVAVPIAEGLARDCLRSAVGRAIEVYVRAEELPSGVQAPERPEVELEAGGNVDHVLRTLEVLALLPRASEHAYTDEEEREVIRRLKAFGYL